MPELPEVESVRRKLEKALKGKRIRTAEVFDDPLVLSGMAPDALRSVLEGARVEAVGRKGKYWWLELQDRPAVLGHLGMSGWIRVLNGRSGTRLVSQGAAPLDDERGAPRFAKLILTPETGRPIVLTDPRRFARLWVAADPRRDPRILALGPDAWSELPETEEFHALLTRRKAPVKGVLLDQKLFAGIGNWIADEALYQSRICPSRSAGSLSLEEAHALRRALHYIIDHAVFVNADKRRFPRSWLFHYRWARGRATPTIEGRNILRETIAGRTCAWVPDLQK